ncbi:MAG: MerR family transcriptional regulator [Lachnospiraceae bacterium]|nr:MerR family transcriptional regulator [Lachnospiraceae bacterium]
MEYSIGEVSRILNVSKDMIRYYEKQGAIFASRNQKNNYRSYNTMEVFWLLEALQHKSWGIPIKGIIDIRKNRFEQNTDEFLKEEIERLNEELSYKQVLSKRLEQVREQIAFGKYNVGNFWVKRIPAVWRCPLITGHGDDYDRFSITDKESRIVFNERNTPFFESGLTAYENRVEWEMTILNEYADALGLSLKDGFSFTPEETALCTHIDIGEVGEFDPGVFEVLPAYAASRGYNRKDKAPMRGTLIGRGYDNGRFHRIVRLYLPIEDA